MSISVNPNIPPLDTVPSILEFDDIEFAELPEGVVAPTLNRALVACLKPKEITAGGIVLTDATKEQEEYLNHFGRLVAHGPTFYNRSGFDGYPDENKPKIGDVVMFMPYETRRFDIKMKETDENGKPKVGKFLLLNDTSIMQIVKRPDLIKIYA